MIRTKSEVRSAGTAQRADRPLRIVHCLTDACGPESSNGVLKAAFQLGEAQRAMGHQVLMCATGAAPRGLPSRVIAMGPDVVHFHSIHIPQNIRLASALRRARIPYCVTVHGGLAAVARRRRPLRKAVFRWLWERQYLHEARFVHALTPEESSDIRRYGVPRAVVVAPNGIDIAALPRSQDPAALSHALPALAGRRVYLYLGRLDPEQKGLDLMIDAFARADLADAVLVLVGPDWKEGRARLEALVTARGLADRVVFHEPVFDTTRADFMAAADVFVHPSRWEGVSLAVLEAAAWRKACLLTRAADPLHELERADAAVVVDGTVDGLADGLRTLAAMNRSQLRELGDRAHAAVRHSFDWRTTADVLIRAYRGLPQDTPDVSARD
jgi:glycosyltransferase involved in cell wall biosynthesis